MVDLKLIKKATEDIRFRVNAIKIRHQYKMRQHVRLSDSEYNEFIEESQDLFIKSMIINEVYANYIEQLDTKDKQIQKSKKDSHKVIINNILEQVIKDLQGESDDKHSVDDLRPDGQGERTETEEAETLSVKS